jgi:hypothetical protein
MYGMGLAALLQNAFASHHSGCCDILTKICVSGRLHCSTKLHVAAAFTPLQQTDS